MKNLFFAITLLVAVSHPSFANAKDKDAKLLGSLTTALKNADKTSVKITGIYKKISFTFSNKTADAFYDADSDDFLCFCVPVSKNELPAGGIESMQARYAGWSMECATMYISPKGEISYYAALKNKKGRLMAVLIDANGKARFFAQMPFAR